MAAALAVGLLAGAAPWVVEAFAHYGGPLTRLHRASEIQGGLGWNLAVDDQAKALEGRTLCRPCTIPWKRPGTTVWWALLPFLAAGGVVVARRPGRSAVILLATGTAVSLAVPYLFLIEYAAPRFLLPAYALLSLPVAECLVRLYDRARRPAGRLTGQWRVVALAAVLAAHLAVQLQVTSRVSASSHSTSADFTAVAAALHRNGIRPPCVISGAQAVPIAYYAGCASRQTGGHDASVTPAGLRDAARRVQAAVLVAAWRPPAGVRALGAARLPGGDPGRGSVQRLSVPAAGQHPGRGPAGLMRQPGRPCRAAGPQDPVNASDPVHQAAQRVARGLRGGGLRVTGPDRLDEAGCGPCGSRAAVHGRCRPADSPAAGHPGRRRAR